MYVSTLGGVLTEQIDTEISIATRDVLRTSYWQRAQRNSSRSYRFCSHCCCFFFHLVSVLTYSCAGCKLFLPNLCNASSSFFCCLLTKKFSRKFAEFPGYRKIAENIGVMDRNVRCAVFFHLISMATLLLRCPVI